MAEKITIAKIRKVCTKPDGYTCFYRKLSFYVTKPILYTSIKPTHITWGWTILGAISALFFYKGDYNLSLIGAILINLAFFLDHIDGNIARYKKIFSDKGYFIDEIGSYILIPLTFIMLGFGGYHKTSKIIWVILALITSYGYLVYTLLCKINDLKKLQGVEKNEAKKINSGTYKKYQLLQKLFPSHFDHFCYAIIILALLGITEWIVLYFAITYNLMWFGRSVYDYLFGFKN